MRLKRATEAAFNISNIYCLNQGGEYMGIYYFVSIYILKVLNSS